MRIGELTQQANVTPRTVRYYESIGLIPPGERVGTGQRFYTGQTVARLKKIEQLKQLGLSLEEIGSLIELYFADPTGRQPKLEVLALLREHLASTESRLGELEQFRAEIKANIDRFERWLEATGKP